MDQRDGSWVQAWPEGLLIPEDSLGTARLIRDGDQGVVFSHGRLMPMAWKAAQCLSFLTGQEIAVMDLRTLKPAPLADMQPLIEKSRGRILLLNEATAANNWMHSLAHEITQQFGWQFEAYPQVLSAQDSPVGQSLAIEQQIVPQIEDVFVRLSEFFRPETLIRIGERVGVPLALDSEKQWFETATLKTLATAALKYAEQHDPVYTTGINPVRPPAKTPAKTHV
jgi:hypothetical protein